MPGSAASPANRPGDPAALPGRGGSSPAPRSRSNHSARSTSGNSCSLPLRGGHSISKVLLASAAGSNSASAAQASTTLPGPLADRAQLDQLLGVERRRRAQLLFQLADRAGARLLFRPRSGPWGSSRRRRLCGARTARRGGRAGTRPRRRRGGRAGCRRCAWPPSTRVLPTRVDGQTVGCLPAESVGDQFGCLAFGAADPAGTTSVSPLDHHAGCWMPAGSAACQTSPPFAGRRGRGSMPSKVVKKTTSLDDDRRAEGRLRAFLFPLDLAAGDVEGDDFTGRGAVLRSFLSR